MTDRQPPTIVPLDHHRPALSPQGWMARILVDVEACVHESRLRISLTRDLLDSLPPLFGAAGRRPTD